MEPLLQETRVLHHPPLSAALPSKGLCLELPTSRPTGIKSPSSPASKVSNHLPTLVPLASPAAREGQEALWKGGTKTQRATAAHSQIARRGGEKNRLPTPTQDSALALWTLMIQVCPVLLLGRVQTKWLGILLQWTQGRRVCRSITPSKKWPQQGSEG